MAETEPVRYQLWHNHDAGFWRPYEPGDDIRPGYEGTLEDFPGVGPWGWPTAQREGTRQSYPAVLEKIWWIHNRDDRPDGQTAWSLSIGDVVVIGECAWSVDHVGFIPVFLEPSPS